VVRFETLPESQRFAHLELLEEVTGAAFGQRRKMLRAALKPLARRRGLKADEWLTSLGIDPARRGETLPLGDFLRMAESLAKPSVRF
jgi:16S rRNA (adenine1518-N6/adenine1519-N6)-dimethyltransferase